MRDRFRELSPTLTRRSRRQSGVAGPWGRWRPMGLSFWQCQGTAQGCGQVLCHDASHHDHATLHARDRSEGSPTLAAEPHTEDGQAAPLPSGDTREGSRAPGTGRPECAGHPSAKRACDACVGGVQVCVVCVAFGVCRCVRTCVCVSCVVWCVRVCMHVCVCGECVVSTVCVGGVWCVQRCTHMHA